MTPENGKKANEAIAHLRESGINLSDSQADAIAKILDGQSVTRTACGFAASCAVCEWPCTYEDAEL